MTKQSKNTLREKIEKILKQKYDFGKVCQFCGFRPSNWLTPTGKRRGVIRHIQAKHILKMPKKSDQILPLIKKEILRGMPQELDDRPEIKVWLFGKQYTKGFNHALKKLRAYLERIFGE